MSQPPPSDSRGGGPTSQGRGALIRVLTQHQRERDLHSVSTLADSSVSAGTRLTSSSNADVSTTQSSASASSSGRGLLLSRFASLNASTASEMSHFSDSSSGCTSTSIAAMTAPSQTDMPIGRLRLIAQMRALQLAKQQQQHHSSDEGASSSTSSDSSRYQTVTTTTTVAATAAAVAPIEPVEPAIVRFSGTKGRPVQIATNYIRLFTDPSKGVFEYDVSFSPSIHALNLRYKLLDQHRDTVIGATKTFDGNILALPHRLPDTVTELVSINDNDSTKVQLRITFKRARRIADCLTLYNLLFDRIMRMLKYVRFGRKRFDPTAPAVIPQHKLEVWPGYVTAVDEYEDGVMLCLDVSHRVLCQRTVLDLMREAYVSSTSGFQLAVQQALIGAIVLTRYNNRTYRVDDIVFDESPLSTFDMNGTPTTYVDYYKSHYNLDIRDHKQPLLVHVEDRVIIGQSEKQRVTFCLIPELCNLTGLTDAMRGDMKLMRDIATITRVTPNQRMAALRKYCAEVAGNEKTREVLQGWGLRLAPEPLQMEARQLDEEEVQFAGQRKFRAGPQADFGKYATSNEVLKVVSLNNWLLMHTRQDGKFAAKFVDCMMTNSKPMGISVCRPQIEVLDGDTNEHWVRALRKCVGSPRLQIVVMICPTSRDDRYAAIKKICCAELPIPSQVINSRTLSNDAKNRAIVQKIALQMNCKLGGSLWSVRIPLVNTMICGVDTYHDPTHKADSVAALVASLNGVFTEWWSTAILQSKKEELGNGLCTALLGALAAWRNANGRLPEKVIVFRDGVGDGQLRMCEQYEVPQMVAAFGQLEPGYVPLLTFVVVQKRINTRVFAMQGNRGLSDLQNPSPGCVLDHTITRRHLYDFFLVPQSVRQGTVSPTHYIVVHDTANFSPDILQRLSYKLCFLYYNWPGTVRVPACCQYAHKMAFLVGESVRRPTAECLADKLFYL